jgi:glyoxylase-like metal-dependent hydrolase (beta-lactamase superfamily II)
MTRLHPTLDDPMQFGDFTLHTISGGRLSLDGGTMFGVVPKDIWQRHFTPDDRNRIEMDTNCLLIRTGRQNVLVETGYGTKATDVERDRFAFEAGDKLLENLAAAGLSPEEIDVVILTHLHFDHTGGATRRNAEGNLAATFPRARHFVQRAEWEDATGNVPELKGSYFPTDFLPLADAGLTQLVDGDADIVPGVSVRRTGGHTRGHQVVVVQSGDARGIYLGDVCPLKTHLRIFWTMSYDQSLLDVRRVKPPLLGEIVETGSHALFDHDPDVRAARLSRNAKGDFEIAEAFDLK